MCGIVGYVGPRDASGIVMGGLARLEYRGYDSAGVATVAPEGLAVRRAVGKLVNLRAALEESPLPSVTGDQAGIGHTRWATHGAPSERNAHPHVDAERRVAVVHNGIIENHAALAAELQVSLASDTDTEVVAQLLGQELARGAEPLDALRTVTARLEGSFGLVVAVADRPGVVYAARRNSPLVLGVGEGEMFIGSDVAAFLEHTREAVEIQQDCLVEITSSEFRAYDSEGEPASTRRHTVDWDLAAAEKDGYDWFMRKEIHEQPAAVAESLRGHHDESGVRLDELHFGEDELRRLDKIIIVGCGTAFYAGLVAKYAIEHWTRVACEVELASEFRYRDPIVGPNSLVVVISQSGETADSLQALRHAKGQGARVLAICNTNGSTIPRESDGVIYTHAGPEIGVASTKGFLTQVVACYLLGLFLAQVRQTRYQEEILAVVAELQRMPELIQQVLDQSAPVLELAGELKDARSVLFLGRHVGYPVALEGALKLKELAYIHAEGFAAGELKHGPIALIEQDLPVFVIVPPQGRDQLHDKVLANISEVRARGARTIVLAEHDDAGVAGLADLLLELPRVSTLLQPLLATVPLQLFACELATQRGHDVDQPRNLAKSVTVE
ncbi:glutamine--fructose-6-phosphate transaminase (isomerizing) [Parenemella sanctibonifatiensis]|uniref:Glutamine--fructose-6-phosphate aminotransferase [isomerizing] n=1 Tax=Parenemella sanctibonifatiensis TaxID=2016505 RepID=A0A255E7Q1_9ACTN|nr:glutamine--fructose-6-phosphate transaminase (isomerizing) [Parenemella sanctibonifatiensis]OYN87607.1 glutamine--fructose-6-phosphate transaminase (isomerizing) [Parenemella sanctibonifatiensis]